MSRRRTRNNKGSTVQVTKKKPRLGEKGENNTGAVNLSRLPSPGRDEKDYKRHVGEDKKPREPTIFAFLCPEVN